MKTNVPLLVLTVFGVAVAAYALTLGHASFRADDFDGIKLVATPEGVTWHRALGYFYLPATDLPIRPDGFYRPLFSLSFALDYAIWETNPLGYTLTNVLLHATSAVLVTLIALKLGGRWMAGLLAGLLFAVYPTHPFSMNYVGDRPDVLASALYLLSVYAYMKFRGGRRRGYLLLALGAFALALLSKEIAVSLPVVVLIYDLYRRGSRREISLSIVSFGAVLAGYLVLRYLNLGTFTGGYKGLPADPTSILPTFARYLGLMLAPYNPNLLGMDYSVTYLVTLLVMIAFVLVLAFRTDLRGFTLFLAAFLVTFLPSVRLFMGWLDGFPGYGRFEQNQHVYLPSAFFCAGLALMIGALSWRRIAWVAAVGLVIFYAGAQQVNNGPWLRASDLVHAAQRNPERLPVSGYEGAFVFLYQQKIPGEPAYMGYGLAMTEWFRGNPTSSNWRDWPRLRGTIAKLDEDSGTLKLRSGQDFEIFKLGKGLQIRLAGRPMEPHQLKVGQEVLVGFVAEDGEKIVPSVEVYGARGR
ncbi:MAG: glycosyltransferase family 39 protein [Rubrobacteraceae bacterium]